MRSEAQRWLLNLLSAIGPLIALGVVILIFGVADQYQENGGNFLTVSNFQSVSRNTATVAVAALGMTFIIISGGIDLSAGTGMALCATEIYTLSLHDALPIYRACVCSESRLLSCSEYRTVSTDRMSLRIDQRIAD